MLLDSLKNYIHDHRCTMLCAGPMSKNCVDAAIELANTHAVPMVLVASRRQIEAEDLGSGYVNNWSTERFAEYVLERDKTGHIILARDHGGPWQNTFEIDRKLGLRQAMESAKKSFQVDIESGFELIHIDPSIDIFTQPSPDQVLERIYELYEFCLNTAAKHNRKIAFEVGTEEQNGAVNDLESLAYVLDHVENFCRKNKFPKPLFVVAQIGTKVMETCNTGSLDSSFRVDGEMPAEIQVPRTIELCNRFGIMLKEHNTDYMSDETLSWHPKLGIHAANVAPEFGVTETRALVDLLSTHGLKNLAEDFLHIAYESKKWQKWMLPQTGATDQDRAVIAGHYVFSDPRVEDIKQKAQAQLAGKKIDLDGHLKEKVKTALLRYLKNFNLMGRRL